MRKRCGFTLIELLVVIAIIAILAAILFPVFARAREKARSASCLSNLKQLSLGVIMYQGDYDEYYTPRCVWGQRIQPYVEARLTWDRLRPEGHEEGFPPPEEEGENTGPQASGFGGTAVAGVFVGITERLFADFSGRFGGFKTSISQLDYLDAPDVASASRWGIRAGLVWFWQGGDR